MSSETVQTDNDDDDDDDDDDDESLMMMSRCAWQRKDPNAPMRADDKVVGYKLKGSWMHSVHRI
eukprot:6480900-Amphidinium_carterae.1